MLIWLASRISFRGMRVLDLGCGEGKNAAWLSRRGADVTAVDISEYALRNAHSAFPREPVRWVQADIVQLAVPAQTYDLVIAYGLLHCVAKHASGPVIEKIKAATKPGGFNILVAFNDRSQELSGHPGFSPTLLPHRYYVEQYRSWDLLHVSDMDLHETHPHNQIPHKHSMTRIVAKAEEENA